nr:hypothetical protein [Tanacetum cinerariifolium]
WLQQQVVNLDSYTPEPSQCQKTPIYYDDDNDEESSIPLRDIIISELLLCIEITPILSIEEPKDSLITGDEHLSTIPKKDSNKFIKSSVENIVPNASESEDECECDVVDCDDSQTINFSRIDEADYDPEEDIHFVERLLYDNSSPRHSEEFNSKNSDAIIESFYPSPIPVEDIDPFMEDIDLFLASDESLTPCIDNDYSNSEGDNIFLERLLHDDHIPLPDILDFSNAV